MKIEDVKVGMRVKNTYAEDSGVFAEGVVTAYNHSPDGYHTADVLWSTGADAGRVRYDMVSHLEPCGEQDTGATNRNKYSREISPGVFVDVYDVLRAFNVTDPCLQHLVKKALAVGQRGHKDAKEDLNDILASAKRAVEMNEKWSN